eukprot:c16073_g1_i1 orf=89-661(+)
MAALCSSSCSTMPSLPLLPVYKQKPVPGWSYRCGPAAPPHTILAAAASPASYPPHPQLPKSLSASILAPLAACLVFTTCSAPATAGIFSGSPGLESIQLPSLPTPEFLKKIQEDNKARYDGLDSKFKSSSFVQELLKRSKENAEKHQKEIQDKYCQRGADWGVGDCSVTAMSEEQRASFMEALKANAAPQ